MSRSNRAQNSVILFTIGMLLTKLSSFLVNVGLSYRYGTSYTSDAIIISMNIPTILFAGFISAIALCYVPLYKEIESKEYEGRNEITSILINTLALVFSIVCAALFFFPEMFIRLFANGMIQEGIVLATRITRWVAIASLLTSTTGILQGYLQANNRFRLVSISVLPVNIVLTTCILFSNNSNTEIFIGTGFIIAYSFQFLLFYVESRKVGYRWSPRISIRNEYIKKIMSMVIPIFIGTLVYDINSIADKSFASILETGNISVLDYSYKVAAAAQGIIAFPLTTILYTKLSEESSRNDMKALRATVNGGIYKLSIFMIPAITGLIAVSDLVIRVLFFRGNFSSQASVTTSHCLILYLIGMYAISYRALIEKVFYSIKLTKITLSNSIVTVAVNIILDFLLYKPLGCYGLAIATSVSLIVSIIYLCFILYRRTGICLERKSINSLAKIIGSSVPMLIIMLLAKKIMENIFTQSFLQEVMELMIICCIGFFVYYLSLLLFREYSLQKQIRLFFDEVVKDGKH